MQPDAINTNDTSGLGAGRPMLRSAVILTGIATAFSLLGDQALYAILPIHYQTLGLTSLQLGLILSMNRFVRLLTNHLAGWLIRRIHFSGLFVGVLVLGAGLTFLYGTWPIFAILIGARLLWGFCWSTIRQIGTMTSIAAMPGRDVGRTVGLYSGLSRAGSITGLALGGLLFDQFRRLWGFEAGWQWCFFVLAGISLLGVIPAATIGRTLRRMSFKLHAEPDGPVPRTSRGLLICGFIVGCVGYGIIFSKLGDVLKMLTGDSVEFGSRALALTTFTALILCSRHIIGLVGGPMLGRLSDRIGHRTSAFVFLMAATILLAVAALVSQSFWAVVVLMIMFFVFTACLIVTLMAEAGRAGPSTFAWLVTALDLGGATGPLLAWTVGDWVKETWMPFAIAAALCFVGTAIALARLIRARRAPSL
ncbi:hypothetical protein LCGC14_0431830 [marine sediment metagenome]|uniref:Major facilitator superfamily (MFS) profile domain-containing protein n=1 Tax=marine sediment metagenome TaxID=412755 RepID=A0A0F9T634_9ZZZZ|nr:MFS transporter [Phycisphaerae bacterium]HDZ44088.1 MFS transporter [Phycisphaerae bacterium]